MALLLGAFFAVIVFLPAEGRIAAPLHGLLAVLLGRAAFLLPVLLAFVGVVLIVRRVRSNAVLPGQRSLGIGLLTLAVVGGEHLLASDPDGTGLLGKWLTTWLVDLVGAQLTIVLLVGLVAIGTVLVFNLKVRRVAKQPDAAG